MRVIPFAAGVLSLCALGAAATAQVGCPTAADAGRPIQIQFEDGYVETHRSTDGVVWTIDGRDGVDWLYRLEVAHGLHLLSYVDVFDGQPDASTLISYDYGIEPAALPAPAPRQRLQFDVKLTDQSGTFDEAQMQAYGDVTSVDIGNCTYDLIPVLIAYDTPDQYVELINYLPELGLGYLVQSQTADDPAPPVNAVSIRLGK